MKQEQNSFKTVLKMSTKYLFILLIMKIMYMTSIYYEVYNTLKMNIIFIAIGGFSSVVGNWVLSDTNYLEKSDLKDSILNSLVGAIIIIFTYILIVKETMQ